MADRRFSHDNLAVRFRILLVLTLLVFGAVAVRLIDLQVRQGRSYRDKAQDNRIREQILRAHRGLLLDRHGRVLADNAPSFQLLLDPLDRSLRRNRTKLETVVATLAEILHRDLDEILSQVERARRTGLAPLTVARNLNFETLSVLEERMDLLAGVEVRPEPARRYPYGTLAAHLIGYLGEVSEEEIGREGELRPYRSKDLIGRAGVERAFEEVLRGLDGLEYVGVDAHGRRTNLFGELPMHPSVRGRDIVLTIDLDLQSAAEAALDSAHLILEPDIEGDRGPRRGCIVALDPSTGEVLAMASRPTFDPNAFIEGLSKEDWRDLSGGGHPLLNRAIQSAYPPGSTFKVVTALAGLRDGGLDPGLPMPNSCQGGLMFGNRFFRCWRKQGHGRLGLHDAIVRSCDVYFYQLGIRVGAERFMEYAAACSLGVPTRIDLEQERSGLVPTIDWYRRARGRPPFAGAVLNLSIGQGELLLTPIGMARFVVAVANGGSLVRPHVVRSVLHDEGRPIVETLDETVVGSLPASRSDLAFVRDALEAVVMDPSGTGKKARVEPFRVAGKTGTAENPHGADHALFFGYAPADDPEIVVVVVLEQSGHGGAIAAPTAQKVLAAYLHPELQHLASAGESR